MALPKEKCKEVVKLYYESFSPITVIRLMQRSLRLDKVTVWANLSSSGIIGLFFFEDENSDVETINGSRYLVILKKRFVPELKRRGVDFKSIFSSKMVLRHTLQTKLFSWLEKNIWHELFVLEDSQCMTPHSSDLSPFFRWLYLKDRVYSPSPSSSEELKAAIRREFETFRHILNRHQKLQETSRRRFATERTSSRAPVVNLNIFC